MARPPTPTRLAAHRAATPTRDEGWPGTRLGLTLTGLALGAAMGLGHVPFAAWWVALPALAAAMGLALPLAAGRAALLGLSFGTGHFAVALHWIVEPFLVDVARHGWMAPFALVGLSVFMASYWAGAWGLAAWLARGPAARLAALALALGLAEMARARLFTGFAWAQPAYLWSETPLYQALAWTGPYGLSVLTALAAGGLALAARRPPALLAPAGLAAVALAGTTVTAPEPGPDAPVVRLVQPNAPQRLKWHPDWIEHWLRVAIDATGAPAGPLGAPDLVVWPEVSVPNLLADSGFILDAVAARAGGAPAALGVQRRVGARMRNSLAVVGEGGAVRDVYDKHHLVPFGEFFPLERITGPIGLRGLVMDGPGYAPGPGPRLVDLPGIGPALPLICYEAVFARDARVEGRPRLMLHVTNDAWFGTFAGPYQHLAQTRARAIEQGLPVARAANTGVSAVIDARGRVLASLPLGAGGHLDARLPPAAPPTLYARAGDAPLAGLLALALAALALRGRAERRAAARAAARRVDPPGPAL